MVSESEAHSRWVSRYRRIIPDLLSGVWRRKRFCSSSTATSRFGWISDAASSKGRRGPLIHSSSRRRTAEAIFKKLVNRSLAMDSKYSCLSAYRAIAIYPELTSTENRWSHHRQERQDERRKTKKRLRFSSDCSIRRSRSSSSTRRTLCRTRTRHSRPLSNIRKRSSPSSLSRSNPSQPSIPPPARVRFLRLASPRSSRSSSLSSLWVRLESKASSHSNGRSSSRQIFRPESNRRTRNGQRYNRSPSPLFGTRQSNPHHPFRMGRVPTSGVPMGWRS